MTTRVLNRIRQRDEYVDEFVITLYRLQLEFERSVHRKSEGVR